VKVVVNGDATELAAGSTIADLVRRLGSDPNGAGIADAPNGAVVPRGARAATQLSEDDRHEVLAATQGG
jgi:sulfur carrier protein